MQCWMFLKACGFSSGFTSVTILINNSAPKKVKKHMQTQCLRFRVQGSGFRVQGSGFRVHQRVQGSGFRVHQRVQGLGFRDSGLVATDPDQHSLFKHITLPDLTHFTHSIALFLTHPPSSTPTSTLTLPSLPPQLTLQVIGTVNGVAQTCASLASAMAPAFAGNVFSYSLQVFLYKFSRSPLNHDRNSAHGAAIQSSLQPFSHSLFRIVPSHRLRETIKY